MKKFVVVWALCTFLLPSSYLFAATVPLWWDAGESTPTFQTYNIYRGSKPDCSDCVKLNAAPITGLKYIDATAAEGNVYYYSLTVVTGTAETANTALMLKVDLTNIPVMPVGFRYMVILP